MADAATMEPETIIITLDCLSGEVTLEGSPPDATSWTPELVEMLRRGASLWCSIEGDLIEMRIKPETLWYRLTGEADDFGGLVAVRCNAEGEPCSAA